MDGYERMLNTLLYSVIADLLEQKPAQIPRLARRLLPVLANESISDQKRYEIIQRIYKEHYDE